MGAAARHDEPGGVGDDDLAYDVLAIALEVALDDHPMRAQRIADHHRREVLPFLARVQVAVNLRQVPFGRWLINRRMQDQRRRDGTAEWRVATIPRIVVAGALDIGRDQPGVI